jgi:hypothetical protein
MKNLIMICALVMLLATFGSIAKAENPVNTSFDLLTYGSPTSWDSPTNVDTGYPQYDYTWRIDYADLQVDGDEWSTIMGYLPETSGSGTEPGLPFVIADDHWGATGIFDVNTYTHVDAEGWGHISVTDISFGQVGPSTVTGFRYGGTATVEGVPEPATVCLLGLGGLAMLSRKPRAHIFEAKQK